MNLIKIDLIKNEPINFAIIKNELIKNKLIKIDIIKNITDPIECHQRIV